ncbi:nucleotidyltransferase domain-containing protein [Candidatus Uhrbacteria bacterium]|nr:nucleotidyltransferase domain-containing protein [Candidatus Uhrbacteria bacterium]
MKIPPHQEQEIKSAIIKIAGAYLDITRYSLFFFGSRVSGTGREQSDVDIGIEGDAPIPLEIMAQIKSDIAELPILHSIDIVDFGNVDDNFKEVAKKTIEVFHKKI